MTELKSRSLDLRNPFRDDLLSGMRAVLVGSGSMIRATRTLLRQLSAKVETVDLAELWVDTDLEGKSAEAVELEIERLTAEALAGLKGSAEALVVDVGSLSESLEGLPFVSLDLTWAVVRAVAIRELIPARSGKVVFLAPPPVPGQVERHAVRAALVNMARTLGIEWSQYGIYAVTLTPGRTTEAEEVAALIAYLLSPAGDYFSGCAIELTGSS